jgi:acetyl-CoA carboxylase biotin carboxylase subunit
MIFNKVLVANRGAVAARVLRALNEMSIPSVAVYSEADAGAPYLAYASETYCIGASPAKESYLNQERILKVLQESNADAIHPGYGFLSENFRFASGVVALEKVFIGPSPKWIEAMGHKTKARELARQYGLPVGHGSEVLPPDQTKVAAAARKIGYPVLVKPAAAAVSGSELVMRFSKFSLSVFESRCDESNNLLTSFTYFVCAGTRGG